MGPLRKTLAVLFGVAFLGVLGVGGYVALTRIVEHLRSMDFQAAAVPTSALAVVLLAAMIITRSIRQTGKQHTGHQLQTEKTAAYQLFMDLWGDFLRYGRTTDDRSSDTFSKELLALDRQLMLYSNAGVVNAYAALRALERHSGTQHPQVRSQVARVIMEMRQDLGVGTHGLAVEKLLPLLLADADQASPPATVSVYQDVQPRVSLAASS